MLGRHVYRVSPLDNGGWSVHKEGEETSRGSRASREEATRFACQLAAADEPSKVVIEEGHGAIADERLFGEDSATELERVVEGQAPPSGEPPGRR